MYLAQNGIIPPKEWQHYRYLRNNAGETVAIILAKYGIIPPKQWIYQKDLPDLKGNTIESLLLNAKYINVTDNKYVPNCMYKK